MKVVAITGGVGGAKLALGLSKVLPPEQLTFAVNTGDDFEHLGLYICPDLDSLTYALAERNNTELGWGRADETWHFIEALTELGGTDWFKLGDRDMALHVWRTELLRTGLTLTQATARLTAAFGIRHTVLPMTDDPVSTVVHTERGERLPFQHYFVKQRCVPSVVRFSFEGIESGALNPALAGYLQACDAVVICPSNPYVSVDPILNLPLCRELVRGKLVVAISPIVGGMAIKGPAAKMMQELDVPATPLAIAEHYRDILDGIIVDETDAEYVHNIESSLEIAAIARQTIMLTLADRISLAEETVGFLRSLLTRTG